MITGKHTTGPWKLGPANDNEVSIQGVCIRIPAPHEISKNGSFGQNYNAKLMAKSPEMFELLAQWVEDNPDAELAEKTRRLLER